MPKRIPDEEIQRRALEAARTAAEQGKGNRPTDWVADPERAAIYQQLAIRKQRGNTFLGHGSLPKYLAAHGINEPGEYGLNEMTPEQLRVFVDGLAQRGIPAPPRKQYPQKYAPPSQFAKLSPEEATTIVHSLNKQARLPELPALCALLGNRGIHPVEIAEILRININTARYNLTGAHRVLAKELRARR